MSVPNVFANATTSIPLVQLDQNFNTGITIGNTTVYLGNTTTSFGNVTLTGAAVNGTVGATTPAAGKFTTINSDATGNLSIQSNGSTIVAVTSSGAAVTGTLSTTAQALIGGASIGGSANAFYGANGNGINYNRNTNTTAGKYWSSGPDNSNNYVVFNQGGTGVYVTDGGTTWTSLSDERLKDIIEPIADATSKVSTLRAVIGKYKTDDSTVRRSFLIAQDVQKVLPEAVDATNENRLGLQYTDTIPLLVAAIKELAARIAALESKQ